MKTFLLSCCLVFFLLSCKEQDKAGAMQEVKASAVAPAVVHGADISHYDGDGTDFINVNADSLSFIICSATEGLTIQDAMYRKYRDAIKSKGLYRGAYHFYYAADDPIQQAQHYLKVTDSLKGSDLPPIVNVEAASINSRAPVAHTIKDIRVFLQRVEAVTGRIPIIYTANDVGSVYFTDTAFSRYHLWIADYRPGIDSPEVPPAWRNKKWLLWQRTGKISTGTGSYEFDVFNGSLADLEKFVSK